MRRTILSLVVIAGCLVATALPAVAQADSYEYKLLATSKTSTMQKEMNEAAAAGYHFEAVMGGETAFGGKEAVVIMARARGAESKQQYKYLLLATQKTGTMQKELSEVADEGFVFVGVTVSETAFGGKEVVTITRRKSP